MLEAVIDWATPPVPFWLFAFALLMLPVRR